LLNDKSVEALAKRSNNRGSRRTLPASDPDVLATSWLDIEKHAFDEVFDAKKKTKKTKPGH